MVTFREPDEIELLIARAIWRSFWRMAGGEAADVEALGPIGAGELQLAHDILDELREAGIEVVEVDRDITPGQE